MTTQQSIEERVEEYLHGYKHTYDPENMTQYDYAMNLLKEILSERNAALEKVEIANEALGRIRNEIFYFMVQNVDQKGAKSYQLLGSIKEELTDTLSSIENLLSADKEG